MAQRHSDQTALDFFVSKFITRIHTYPFHFFTIAVLQMPC